MNLWHHQSEACHGVVGLKQRFDGASFRKVRTGDGQLDRCHVVNLTEALWST